MKRILRFVLWLLMGDVAVAGILAALAAYLLYTPNPELPRLSGTIAAGSIVVDGRERTHQAYVPKGLAQGAPLLSSLNPHADPRWTFPHFPPTLQAYRGDPVYWSSQIHEEEKQRQRGQTSKTVNSRGAEFFCHGKEVSIHVDGFTLNTIRRHTAKRSPG